MSKDQDELAVLWGHEWSSWTRRHGFDAESKLSHQLLRWHDSEKPYVPVWQAWKAQIRERAEALDISPEEFVKRLFGHETPESFMQFFRGD